MDAGRAKAAFPGLENPLQLIQRRATNREQLIEQFTLQCRPMLAVELHRLRAVCDLPRAERERLISRTEKLLKDAALEFADAREPLPAGQVRTSGAPPWPRAGVTIALLRAASEQLSADVVARYRSEAATRDEYRKQALVQNLIAQYNDALNLSVKQRGRIGGALLTAWDDQWDLALGALNNRNQYLAATHLNLLPFLDERQKALWKETYAASGSVWKATAFLNNIVTQDAPIMEEELGKPAIPDGVGVFIKRIAP
jgi:hypothetical protein